MIRLFLAILLGKILYILTRISNTGGGSAAPGLYALKIDPNLVKKLIKNIDKNIVVTGTNGKTTTSRLITNFAKQNYKVINNATGSNLERGIASSLIKNSNIFSLKVKNKNLGIWELDEAAFNKVVSKINPSSIIFLNVFRDQLDRYGEIDYIISKWKSTLQTLSSNTTIILNADDENILSLKDSFAGKVKTFGVTSIEHQIIGENKGSNLGTRDLSFSADNINLNDIESSEFDIHYNKDIIHINFPLPGIYHIYDFLAAFSVAINLHIAKEEVISVSNKFLPAFGRVEKINIGNKLGYIFLIKNPTGANEVFETISSNLKLDDTILLILNDNFADGQDVSWIWDAKFEKFVKANTDFICSGTRAQDIALRIKYTGLNTDFIKIEPHINKALDLCKSGSGRIFIFPTYSALLKLQKIFATSKLKSTYWKE